MIDFNQIEQELGVQTLMTDKQQAAIENWYRVAIKGEACDRNPDTKALGLPQSVQSLPGLPRWSWKSTSRAASARTGSTAKCKRS